MGKSVANYNLNKCINFQKNFSDGKTSDEQQRTQTVASRNVYVVPEFRKEPDIAKLGQAFIMLAKSLAEKSNQ